MKENIKKLLSFNIVMLMMISLIISPVFVDKVEAEEISKFEEVLIVDGKEYDALSEYYGKSWMYEYNEENDVVNLYLRNYNGGSIYCSKSLTVVIVEDSEIRSNNKPAIESRGNLCISSYMRNKIACDFRVIAKDGYNAIKASGDIFVWANCELISANCSAVKSENGKIYTDNYYCNITTVGKNAEDAEHDIYKDQSYIKINYKKFNLKLNGNGGKLDNNSVLDLICNVGYDGMNLGSLSNLYALKNKKQLGWTVDLEAFKKDKKNIIGLNGKLYIDQFYDEELEIYAVWGTQNDIVVQLHDMLVEDDIKTETTIYKKGKSIVLPDIKYAGKKVISWCNKDKTKTYNIGDKIKLREDIELFPEFKNKKCIIDGEEIEIGDRSCYLSDSWYIVNSNSKLELYILDNFVGKSIYLPGNTVIRALGNIKIESDNNLPTLDVDGDLILIAVGNVKLNSNNSKPAIRVNGNLNIESYGNSEIEIVTPSPCSAINCSGEIETSSNIFCVGNNKDETRYTDKYNNESYFKINSHDCCVYGQGKVVIPEVPKYLEKSDSVFLGWTDFTEDIIYNHSGINTCWYKPEQEAVNSELGISIYPFYKPYNDFAVRLYGNGGINKKDRDFSVWYMSSPSQLEMNVSDFEFSKEGCSLKSWNTKADGTGTNYDLNSHVKKGDCKNKYGVIDLYAIWEDYSIVYKSDNDAEEIDVELDEKLENKLIKSVTENNLKNIDIKIVNKAKFYNIKLSKHLIDSIKSNCSVTLKTNIGNIIIPKKSLSVVDDEININIKKLEENKMQINKNIDKDIKIELDTDKENLLLKINHNEESLILPKLIKENNKLQFILSNMDNVIEIVEKDVQFEDNNDEKQWYYDAVQFVGNRELFTVKDNKFEPNEKVVRSELVSILHRLENRPEANECNFKDIKNEDVFATAVAWASNNNIVKGTLKGFEPNKQITREQLCVMIYNYAKYLGLDINVENIELAFDDNNEVSSWSIDAVKWMVEKELLKGSYNKINPRGNTTNAQLATIVKRFVEMIVNDVK